MSQLASPKTGHRKEEYLIRKYLPEYTVIEVMLTLSILFYLFTDAFPYFGLRVASIAEMSRKIRRSLIR
jgi:hypothetical protein